MTPFPSLQHILREALAVVWAVEKLHLYLFKATLSYWLIAKLLSLSLTIQSQNLQLNRMLENLRLQDYDFVPKAMKIPQITCQGIPA